MARRLSDISSQIRNAGNEFKIYLQSELSPELYSMIVRLSQLTDVYIFSGIIRNYFLGIKGFRDIDIVLGSEIDVESFFSGSSITRNSFDGYKICYADTSIDLWYLNNTWALRQQPHLHFEPEKAVPSTAFFNFSAIIYSFNDNKFYASHRFLQFLRDKKIDIVHEPNSNLPLCVVNTIYYQDKLNLKVADRMKRHILELYKSIDTGYQAVQQKHFGSVLYSEEQIHERMHHYAADLNTEKKRTCRNNELLLEN